jgi:hypothetical protein
MLTTYPGGDDALSLVHAANADDAADSVPLDRARDVTPIGMPHCKNAGTTAPA